MIQALKRSQLADIIEKLPLGLESPGIYNIYSLLAWIHTPILNHFHVLRKKERYINVFLLRPKLVHETIGLQQKWGIYPFIESKINK